MTGQPTAVEVREQVAAMLYQMDHPTMLGGLSAAAGWAQQRYRERSDMLAAAGLLVTPEHDAQVAARALREAAGSIDGPDWAGYEYAAADWLNACADRIERGEAT